MAVPYPFTTFFVLNGWVNGRADTGRALTTDGTQLKDGWYALQDGDADPFLDLPFETQEAAEEMIKEFIEIHQED